MCVRPSMCARMHVWCVTHALQPPIGRHKYLLTAPGLEKRLDADLKEDRVLQAQHDASAGELWVRGRGGGEDDQKARVGLDSDASLALQFR